MNRISVGVIQLSTVDIELLRIELANDGEKLRGRADHLDSRGGLLG